MRSLTCRADAGQRLVEHEKLGVVNQRAGERRLLLHAAGKALATLAAMRPQAELGEQKLAFFARNSGFDAPQARDEFQVFERIELVIEHRLVGQPGDDALGFDWILARVDAENSDFSRIRRQKPGDHAQRRGLAGAVGPNERVKFARPNREVETIDRLAAKALGQG